MAITSNGLGKFSGKLGGAVFVIRNGKQIVREYNPRPSNPKSTKQLQQRAKGNLAGRISSFVPKTAIMGLGINGIRRRSRFNQLLLNAANVTLIDGDYQAKIPWESLLFSEGSVVSSFRYTSATAQSNTLQVSLTGLPASSIPAAVYEAQTMRLVVMVYDAISQDLVEVATKMITKPAQGASAVSAIPILHPIGYVAAIFGIPMSTSDGSAVSITTDLAGMTDTQIAASLSANANSITFDYGRTVFFGQANFTPSITSAAPSDTKKLK